MDGFERRKEQSREKILNAAEALFIKHGTSKVSVDDIARKAGVSKVTIYNLFGSKENLVHDCKLTVFNRIAGHSRKILTWKKSYLEKVQDIIQYWIDISNKYNLETISPELHDSLDPQSDPEMKNFQAEFQNLYLEFIKDGKKQGDLNPDISDEAASIYLEIFMQGINASPEIHAKFHRDPKLAHELFQLMLYGFSPAPEKAKKSR
jgi:AcrR family transcriptional regulator